MIDDYAKDGGMVRFDFYVCQVMKLILTGQVKNGVTKHLSFIWNIYELR